MLASGLFEDHPAIGDPGERVVRGAKAQFLTRFDQAALQIKDALPDVQARPQFLRVERLG